MKCLNLKQRFENIKEKKLMSKSESKKTDKKRAKLLEQAGRVVVKQDKDGNSYTDTEKNLFKAYEDGDDELMFAYLNTLRMEGLLQISVLASSGITSEELEKAKSFWFRYMKTIENRVGIDMDAINAEIDERIAIGEFAEEAEAERLIKEGRIRIIV